MGQGAILQLMPLVQLRLDLDVNKYLHFQPSSPECLRNTRAMLPNIAARLSALGFIQLSPASRTSEVNNLGEPASRAMPINLVPHGASDLYYGRHLSDL